MAIADTDFLLTQRSADAGLRKITKSALQTSLSVTESQISDLGSYVVDTGDTMSGALTVTDTVTANAFVGPVDQSTRTSGTLVAADANKSLVITGNIAIPNSVFSAGDMIILVNNTTTAKSLTSSLTTLRLAGAATSSGTRTIGPFGMACLYFTSATSAVVGGSAVT